MREVSESRPDDDGERDSTTFFGSRAVSLEVVVLKDDAECEQILDKLKSFLHPQSRPYLYVEDTGWGQERRLRLRVDQWSEPYSGYVASQARQVQLQWKAPDGTWEAVDPVEETVLGDLPSDSGRTYPKTYPWSYPPTTATGTALVTSPGSVPSHFTARLYGPCSGPQLINETTGERIGFLVGLALAAGEYVEIDTRAQTAYLLSNADASRLNVLDFAASSWWRLQPGDNSIRYAPLAGSSGSAAVITYRPAWF
jgi:hypothetical protein